MSHGASRITVVLISIGERIAQYRSLTEPFWRNIAHRLHADLNVLTERLDPVRKHAGWQKLLLPSYFASKYDYVIYADVDILPHPATPLEALLAVPAGKVGVCQGAASDARRPKRFYAKALDLPPHSANRVTNILNTGLLAWRTSGSEAIQSLFQHLYLTGKQHCGEQSCLSWAVQQHGLLHLLPDAYNVSFVRQKPTPFNTFFCSRAVQRTPGLGPVARWSDEMALSRVIKQPCFVHFVGGIFYKALKAGASRLASCPSLRSETDLAARQSLETPALSADPIGTS